MIPEELRARLQRFGQEHVLAAWERLDTEERRELISQLQAIDLETLSKLFRKRDKGSDLPDPAKIRPVPRVEFDKAQRQRAKELGEKALRNNELAVLVVAGGQGTRLGFDHPKGMFAIGPVSHKSLFQIHAEKVLALRRRFRAQIPFLIMTSPATHRETILYFQSQKYFGLPEDDVLFFSQGTMPALDIETGRLLLEAPGRLALSPNGHGGTLTGLAEHDLLGMLREQGVRGLFYFQVDNPLVKIGDPEFLGHHLVQRAEVSSKVVPKSSPTDKQGNFVVVDGRCTMIEYSDLPEELAHKTDEHGDLLLWAGNPAIHIFDLAFLEKVTQGDTRIPWHIARKKVPYCNEQGQIVEPRKENALKFEMFIFDVLPRAERWTLVPTDRREEFCPLKNASGANSPVEVRAAISNLAGDWLERAGVKVPRDNNVPLEISPLFALDAEELMKKVNRNLVIDQPTYLY